MASASGDGGSTGAPVPKVSFSNWLTERKKLLGYELHHFFLVEYQKAKRVPRALRINLRPTWFSTDKAFCAEFEGLLKKCSMDLMDLTMKQLLKEIKKCKEEIEWQEESLEKVFTPHEWSALKMKSEHQLQILRLEIEGRKKRKFMRDEEDYRKGKVYKWTEEPLSPANSFQQLDQRRSQLETITEETALEMELLQEADESTHKEQIKTTSEIKLVKSSTLTFKEPMKAKRTRGGRRPKRKALSPAVQDSSIFTQQGNSMSGRQI